MGADIHITLGYIKRESLQLTAQLEHLTDDPASKSIKIRNVSLCVGDIVLRKMEDRADKPKRSYDLFAWLSDVRGYIRPLLGSEKANMEWQEKTIMLIRLLAEHEQQDVWDYKDDITSGDHSFNLLTTPELLSFDYDQVYEADPRYHDFKDCTDVDYHNNVDYDTELWIKHPKGYTYKDLFQWKGRNNPGNWFCFLEYLKTHNVDFIIVGFDN